MGSNRRQFQLKFIVEEAGLLRDFLHGKNISKRTLTAVKYQGGNLYVDGEERDVRYPLQVGQEVRVVFPKEEQSSGLLAEEGPLSIVYEDAAFLIIDKPAGIQTIPSLKSPTGTIANRLAGKFLTEEIPATVHIVTRLDNDTSGLLCVAKNRHIHHLLNQQMMQKQFNRTYQAIVQGHVAQDSWQINAPIGRKEGSIIERQVCESGQKAITNGRVIERFFIKDKPFSHVSLRLETGRTHQIRVHMQWFGHALVGDDLYGGQRTHLARQALHCAYLSFRHPLTGDIVEFTSPLAGDMHDLLLQMTD